jgi:hypothetical protein
MAAEMLQSGPIARLGRSDEIAAAVRIDLPEAGESLTNLLAGQNADVE